MKIAWHDWLPLVRPGDWLVLAGGAAVAVGSVLLLWRGGVPDKAVVRAGGTVYAELPLSAPATIDVPGPIGITHIEIQPGRARVASDPGPRQYCVLQGWLTQAGSVAICAPNAVSLSLKGRSSDYDSLNY